MGILIKESMRGRPWEAWGIIDHENFVEVILGTFTCDTMGCKAAHLHEGLESI